jgi:hypothetical protein
MAKIKLYEKLRRELDQTRITRTDLRRVMWIIIFTIAIYNVTNIVIISWVLKYFN